MRKQLICLKKTNQIFTEQSNLTLCWKMFLLTQRQTKSIITMFLRHKTGEFLIRFISSITTRNHLPEATLKTASF